MIQAHEVIIIGSGFGGQLAAINLTKLGINDFKILERRSYMGGTWSQNTYPGAAVDVQSALYSISFEPYDWSQLYAGQSELRSYTNYVIDKHGLRDKTQTSANVTRIAWQEDAQRWHIDLDGTTSFSARFVINASGPLSTPVIPDFKGKDNFNGASFHTNDWDHEFDYCGKKVAIIGSGASAAQIIPEIAPAVGKLHVFQRSPHWVMPRGDYVFKGWQRALLKNRWLYKLLRVLVYWNLETRVLGFKYSKKLLDILGTRKANKLLSEQISDPELRAKVTADFTLGCKRVILSDSLYPAYQRENVVVHDKEDGIAEITANGIVSGSGDSHELDLIIYSTGYDATDGVISYPVEGRGGLTLAQFWDDFPRAYLGTTAPGFPNLFVVTGPNTGIGHTSALFIIEAQMKYIMNSISAVKDGGHSSIEVSPEAEERYTQLIHREMARTVWQNGGCNSWYKSKSGKVIAMFPGFSFTFRRLATRFRQTDHRFDGDCAQGN